MDEASQHAGIGQALEVPAWLAELDALTQHLADGEAAPDERVEVDPACEQIAPRRFEAELDSGFRS